MITLILPLRAHRSPQAVSFLLGNGTGGLFRFTNINVLGLPFITQFGIVQYSSNMFDGIYYTTLSYEVNLDVVGDYLLTYYRIMSKHAHFIWLQTTLHGKSNIPRNIP